LVAKTVFMERASFWPQTGDDDPEDADPDLGIFWKELFERIKRGHNGVKCA
jgi:hypothetical protein